MDKLKLKYDSIKNINQKYEFRIPEDFNWFVITRYKELNENDYIEEQIIYNNGKIFFISFSVINDMKKDLYYNKIEKEEFEKEFLFDLLNRLGINKFTLYILKKLNFDTNYLRRKYFMHMLTNIKNKYSLSNVNDEQFNIKEKNTNNNLANIFVKNNKFNIEVKDNIDIMKLLKKFN